MLNKTISPGIPAGKCIRGDVVSLHDAEQFARGDLFSFESLRKLEAHLQSCAACAGRIDAAVERRVTANREELGRPW